MDIFVIYFFWIYFLYGIEMDEVMKGFEVIDVGLFMKIFDWGFMIVFLWGMGFYWYLDLFFKGDFYLNISFFMFFVIFLMSIREKMEENCGNVIRGLFVYLYEMVGRFKFGFLEEIEIVGIYFVLDFLIGNWICWILDLERWIFGFDLEYKWIVKGDEMVFYKFEEWFYYD